ncbi:tri m 2 allergen [Colletotrichum truncatum]|uniref:Tri m 2 allergen n=1 Tax=Colletotrichum truncatum TaxID=5467 RepID=A0ACC3YSC0_COLTU
MRPLTITLLFSILTTNQVSAILPYSLPYFTPGSERRTAEPPPGSTLRFVKPAALSGVTGSHSSSSDLENSLPSSLAAVPTSLASAGTSLPAYSRIVQPPGSSSANSIPFYTNSSAHAGISTTTSATGTGVTVSVATTTVFETVTVVNINGSPLPLDQPAVTYAQRGAPSILISAGSVALASTTFALPSQPTTITADGATLTFGEASTMRRILSKFKSSKKTQEKSEDRPEPTTAPDQTSTSPPPAETSIPYNEDSPFDHTWIPLPVIVKIDGVDYYPPTEHEDPIEIFLKDGSTALLAYKSLKIRDRTVEIPDKVSSDKETIDDIEFVQRSFESSSSGDGDSAGGSSVNPFDALKGIFAGLSVAAGPLALAVTDFSAKAMNVALNAPGGVLSGPEFSLGIELQDLTKDALELAEQASQFQNQLESARMNQGELENQFQPINGKVFQSYPKSRAATNLIKSVAHMLQNLHNIPAGLRPVITQKFGEVLVKGIASTGFMIEAYNVYAILNNINWDNVVLPVAGGQAPSSSVTLVPTSSMSTMSTSTSTATNTPQVNNNGRKGKIMVPIPTGPPQTRIISAAYGAISTKDFRNFAKWLDGSIGEIYGAHANLPTEMAWPAYLTDLTSVQEEAIKKMSWVRSVKPNFEVKTSPCEAFVDRRRKPRFRDVSNSEKPLNTVKKRDISVRLRSPSHLNMISGDVTKDYKYHPSLGQGVTIFVIDTGFNTDHEELAGGSRRVEAWYVGNKAVMKNNRYYTNEDQLAPDNTIDYAHEGSENTGHGSGVACVAGGRSLGVASNANLYLVKFKGAAMRQNGRYTSIGATKSSIYAALQEVIGKVDERHLQGKAVVNLSFRVDEADDLPEIQKDFEFFQRNAELYGIVVVMAAGNNGDFGTRTGDHLPQLLGTQDNHLITVGGVNKDGTLWHNSEPEGRTSLYKGPPGNEGKLGSVSLYAQSAGVVTCIGNPLDKVGTKPRDGTSFASPQVAGLVAYFLAHPEYSKNFIHVPNVLPGGPSVGLRMKLFLQAFASFQRRPSNDLISKDRKLAPDYPIPSSLRVAYNLINGDMKDVDKPQFDEEKPDDQQPGPSDDQKKKDSESRKERQGWRDRLKDKLDKCKNLLERDFDNEAVIDVCHPPSILDPDSPTSTSTTSLVPSSTATPSPAKSCSSDNDCDSITCEAEEVKKCASMPMIIPALPALIRTCRCVPKEDAQIPTCNTDADCEMLKCDESKAQEKSCVASFGMLPSLFVLRQCKCTDPKPTEPVQPSPSPPPPSPKPSAAPNKNLPNPLSLCDPNNKVKSCAAYTSQYCKADERASCNHFPGEHQFYCQCQHYYDPMPTDTPDAPGCPGRVCF